MSMLLWQAATPSHQPTPITFLLPSILHPGGMSPNKVLVSKVLLEKVTYDDRRNRFKESHMVKRKENIIVI